MDLEKPNVVVTGISGALGLSLLPELSAYTVTGIGLHSPGTNLALRFVQLDLGMEQSCRELFLLLRELRPVAVIHLAFVMDPASEHMDADRAWQINVGGAARVMEALTEVNRDEEIVKKLIFLSCATAYGPEGSGTVTEDSKLTAHTMPIAIHKMESDQAVQQRAPSARDCSVYVLRSAAFVGPRARNHLLSAFKGKPFGRGKFIAKLFRNGERNPFILPWGARYLDSKIQFAHLEDVARLIVFILRKTEPEARRLTVLNVAARGEPVTLRQCFELARAKLIKVPGKDAMRHGLSLLRKLGISEVPAEATPYFLAGQIMNTDRLREFLGPYYGDVIRFSAADAFADSVETQVVRAHEPASVEA